MSTRRNGAFERPPRNRAQRCAGRSVIREDRNHPDPEVRGKPILDADGARQYKPCEGYAAFGTDYCASHGGGAPQSIAAAKRELIASSQNIAVVLVTIAQDEGVAPETRVKAASQVLDRVGVRAGVDIGVEAPGWQKVLGKMFGTDDDAEESPDEPAAPPPVKKTRARATKPVAPAPARPKFEGW